MSGAMLSGVAGNNARRFEAESEPRRAFGTRRSAHVARSVDSGVADMRRRIGGASAATLPGRLPWAIGGVLIAVLSAMLWMDAFQMATTLAHELARIL